ncbi:MAG TPA: hypothetical protein VNT50_13985 [Microbacterium sp.]|uniref:hypothetical protein n=1 Tax=Microbacterium sp. TaxID=51671 RepID=UPI002BC8FB0C|nr:hypothetical protein [Microbacterium sp.]HWI32590.1 hypothetical protein [Microbacterium sp.]
MAPERSRRRRSAAVYRRRRLVLLVAAIVVIGLIVWLFVAQPWTGSATDAGPGRTPSPTPTSEGPTAPPAPADATPDPEAGDTPAPSSTPAATEPAVPTAGPCVAAQMQVVAMTDKDTYAAGENPQLSIQLTNLGTSDCTLNVGTTTQVFTVSSGNDTWWRSTDCQSAPSDMVVLLAAGQTVTSAAPLAWDRTRSSVDTCQDPNRQRATGGGASYHVRVEIGGIASTETKQILLY